MKMSDTTNATKKQKLMSSEDEQRMELAVAGPSHELPSPKIFKLDIDCFNEIFEYLSLKDLHSFGEPCKTMQQVAGEYFKQNYSAAENFCDNDGIYTREENSIYRGIYTSVFNEFMPCIALKYYKLAALQTSLQYIQSSLQYFQSHIDEFKSTNHIYLDNLTITTDDIVKYIKNILPKIEIVQIRNCFMIENFYELMLKYCDNLKCLYLQDTNSSFNGKHEWLLHNYPKLEQLELIPFKYAPVIDELNTFFDRNPKVQRFSTSAGFLWANRNRLLKWNAKLDVLEVKAEYFNDIVAIGTIWDLLIQLHKKGFYKRLFIYTNRVGESLSIELNSVPYLELLCIRYFYNSFSLPLLNNLKKLIILNGLNTIDAQHLANGLVNLERLYVDETTIDVILPFIRQSTKLKKIKMFPKFIEFTQEEEAKWLNLIALNKEREKLSGARKITIYVRDDVFLATKLTTRNGDINLSLIELKRSNSFEWKHRF